MRSPREKLFIFTVLKLQYRFDYRPNSFFLGKFLCRYVKNKQESYSRFNFHGGLFIHESGKPRQLHDIGLIPVALRLA